MTILKSAVTPCRTTEANITTRRGSSYTMPGHWGHMISRLPKSESHHARPPRPHDIMTTKIRVTPCQATKATWYHDYWSQNHTMPGHRGHMISWLPKSESHHPGPPRPTISWLPKSKSGPLRSKWSPLRWSMHKTAVSVAVTIAYRRHACNATKVETCSK